MPPFPYWPQVVRYKLKWHFSGILWQKSFFRMSRYGLFDKNLFSLITPTSNGRHLNSPAPRLSNCLFQADIKGNVKAPHHWPFVKGIHRWLVDSPHKAPVMRKVFPFHDDIRYSIHLSCYTEDSRFVMFCYASVQTGFTPSRLLSWLPSNH